MVAITQPTVRMPPNSAGTSSTTMRCLTFPPPPSSPLQPISCFTPPCDGAVGHKGGTLIHQSSNAFCLFRITALRTWCTKLQLTCRGITRASGHEISSVPERRTVQAHCATLQLLEEP